VCQQIAKPFLTVYLLLTAFLQNAPATAARKTVKTVPGD
jgi:hypothetical protein